MKKWWAKQASRIDALTLRERVIFFVVIVACGVALADTLWLAPAQARHKQLVQRLGGQEVELVRLRDELRSMPPPVDVNKALRAEIAELQDNAATLQSAIAEAVPSAKNGLALEQVLVQFLRKQDGLTLLGTGTLKADAAAAAPQALPGLNKRGVELRVSGPYANLTQYVKTLELAMPRLRWGPMALNSEKQPPELSLQVYVLELAP